MWIFTKHGAMSVVEVPSEFAQGDLHIQVRGRSRSHLEKVKKEYCNELNESGIVELPGADYQYRFYMSRHEFVAMLTVIGNDIDYTNFNNAVGCDSYHSLLVRIWQAFWRWSTEMEGF